MDTDFEFLVDLTKSLLIESFLQKLVPYLKKHLTSSSKILCKLKVYLMGKSEVRLIFKIEFYNSQLKFSNTSRKEYLWKSGFLYSFLVKGVFKHRFD